MWKHIYEMGVLAHQEVASSIGFLGKYVINFARLHTDCLGYGQLIWTGILSRPEFRGVVQLKGSGVGNCFLGAGARCVIRDTVAVCAGSFIKEFLSMS